MRVRPASRSRLLLVLTGAALLASLWSGPAAVAQAPLPDADDVTSQVEQAGDLVKDTVDEVEDGVKDVARDPAGTLEQVGNTVNETGDTVVNGVSGGSEEAAGTTATSAGAGSSSAGPAAGRKAEGKKKIDRRNPGEERRRGKKSATVAENDVEELVSAGNEISGTEVAGTRIAAGSGEQGGGALSLTGAALLAYLVMGTVLLSVGSLLRAGCAGVVWSVGACSRDPAASHPPQGVMSQPRPSRDPGLKKGFGWLRCTRESCEGEFQERS